jgi:hypothetical protein
MPVLSVTFKQSTQLIMSVRSFWIIVLRIFGLYVLLQVLDFIPRLLSGFAYAFSSASRYSGGSGAMWSAISLLFLALSVLLFMLITFLFRPERTIDALHLERSIKEEKLEFNIHRSTLLTVVVIVAGLIMFIGSLPNFLEELYDYFQQINSYRGFKDYPHSGEIIFALIKVFISFFMITGSRLIVNFIERKRRGKTAPVVIEE